MDPLTLEAATSLQRHPSGLLSCDRAKIWTDGGLGAKTAAMLEPYADDKDSLGTGLFFSDFWMWDGTFEIFCPDFCWDCCWDVC